MNEKRRRNRVQGGWGDSGSTSKVNENGRCRQIPAQQPLGKQKLTREGQSAYNAYMPVTKEVFVYKPTQEIKERPVDITYSTSGCYCLSKTFNGISEVELNYDFIDSEQREWMFEDLKNNIPWKQENICIMGEVKTIPRLTAWYGDIPYTYSGLTLAPYQFSPLLNILRDQVEKKTGIRFNSMLANFYRHEKDSVDWHSDDESSLGDEPVIASLSFGELRNFEMRQKPLVGDLRDYSLSQHVKVPLSSGSLLVMRGSTQRDWQHRIPKEYHDHGERINLTFRVIH